MKLHQKGGKQPELRGKIGKQAYIYSFLVVAVSKSGRLPFELLFIYSLTENSVLKVVENVRVFGSTRVTGERRYHRTR